MVATKRRSLLAISLTLVMGIFITNTIFASVTNDKEKSPFSWNFSGLIKTGDTYFGKNITMLNSCNPEDQVFYNKHTLDLNAELCYLDLVKTRFSMRTKATWGNNEIIPVTTSPTKIDNAVGQDHKHHIGRHMFWMREAWLEFSINEALSQKFGDKPQTFTLGAFPFAIGRGIALGSAYAVSPNYLGFYSDTVVDQYAFGGRISGVMSKDKLTYDIYVAILNNQSDNLGRTGKKILGQQYGRLHCPERGFGSIDYVFATRLNIVAFSNKEHGTWTFEPYLMYNNDPEQTVDFLADSSSRLGTAGMASEFEQERFEFGFDLAVNFGRQKVKGWDYNTIDVQNRNGELQMVNSHVYVNSQPSATSNPGSAYKAPYVTTGIQQVGTAPAGGGTVTIARTVSTATPTAQTLVDRAPRTATQNSQNIGIAANLDGVATFPDAQAPAQSSELFNAFDRFRDPYENVYKGWMFVADSAVFFYDRDVRLAATAAYASGDQDPNHIQKDGDYTGFIGLQELYAGKRVMSAFYLGSSGKLRLPLDAPPTEEQPNPFAAITSGFTNLALVGAGFTWEPSDWEKMFSINPNILAFWQPSPDRKFDLATVTTLDEPSRSFLGLEFNLFFKKELMENLKLFGITSVFIPGSHFYDVKGKPMNAAQFKVLDRRDKTGYNDDPAPGLGTDLSYTLNVGFEYKF